MHGHLQGDLQVDFHALGIREPANHVGRRLIPGLLDDEDQAGAGGFDGANRVPPVRLGSPRAPRDH